MLLFLRICFFFDIITGYIYIESFPKLYVGEEMKEVEVFIGIILIVVGAILFEMNWGSILRAFGLILVSAGVIIYVVAVDSIDETEKKKRLKGRVW